MVCFQLLKSQKCGITIGGLAEIWRDFLCSVGVHESKTDVTRSQQVLYIDGGRLRPATLVAAALLRR